MEEVKTIYESTACKCCLKNGGLKNMWAKVSSGEGTVCYGEMLKECFALPWAEPKDCLEKICERCVQRLKVSLSFRKEILSCQEILDHMMKQESKDADETCVQYIEVKNYENDVQEDTIIEEYEYSEYQEQAETVKYETEDDSQEETADEEPVYLEEALQETDMEVEYLEDDDEASTSVLQQKTQNKKQKEYPKMTKYKKYSQKELHEAVEMVISDEMSRAEAAQRYNIPIKTLAARIKDMKKEDVAGDGKDAGKSSRINVKHYENIRSILLCSNATPIKGHWGIGYACCFCESQYPDPTELKTHNLYEHDDLNIKAKFMKGKSSHEFIVKLDVTNLICELCNENIDEFKDLLNHLKEKHAETVHDDIPNQIIPFKFDTDVLKCAICDKEFAFFKLLNEHMNEHYRNFECNVCNRSFITKSSLRMHKYRHESGEFPCAICSKVFTTGTRRSQHERVFHRLKSRAHKCGYCSLKFCDAVAKNKHENKVHGAEMKTHKCQACDATFYRISSLKHHTQSFHLQHRPHSCPICNKTFSEKRDLKRHIATHTGFKPFQCNKCSKSFTRQNYLKTHVMKHEV